MRWLVTGGCGFIGRSLVRRLLADPVSAVRIVDNLSVGSRADLDAALGGRNARIELVEGDIRDEALALRAAQGIDAVVHLAANTGVLPSIADPRVDCLTNVVGTLNYLEACRRARVTRFVFASSGAPVGECVPPIHEEMPVHPISPYGASKLAGEAYCSAYCRSFAVNTVALRFGNCYGPNSSHKTSVVAKFIREALSGEAWEIYGDGGQTRDFIYLDDIVEAIILAATVENVGGEVFQIATNRETTIAALAALLKRVLAENGVVVGAIHNSSPRTGEVNRNYSDVRKAASLLGWSAQVGLDEGLARTVRWFLNRSG